jgi:CrcB protein
MERFLWVCAGGAVGSGARYLASVWLLERCGTALPWGTLAVNVAGSFLLGFVVQTSALHAEFPPLVRLALTAGVLGGFTTYSSFNQETLGYLERGATWNAGLNVVLTLAICLAAGFAGQSTARFVAG